MKKIVLSLISLSIITCLSCNKKKDQKVTSEVGKNLKFEIFSHAVINPPSFVGVVNALNPVSNKYIDILVNNESKGTQATFDENSFLGGKIKIESSELSKVLTLAYIINSEVNTSFSVFMYRDDSLLKIETIPVDSGIDTRGTFQILSKD